MGLNNVQGMMHDDGIAVEIVMAVVVAVAVDGMLYMIHAVSCVR